MNDRFPQLALNNVVAFPTQPPRLFSYNALRCGVSGLMRYHPKVIDEFDDIMVILGTPVDVVLGCQSDDTFELIGDPCGQFHVCDEPRFKGQLGSLAIDISVPDPFIRGELFSIAWEWNWSVGWSASSPLLHIDRRDLIGLPQAAFTF